MDMSQTIELGDTVKDVLFGFTGIVEAKIVYIYGCTQFQVRPKWDEKGEYPKSAWIDEPQLKIKAKGNGDNSEPTFGGIREKP